MEGSLKRGKSVQPPDPHICCCRDHTGDMPNWEILKLPPNAAVMCLGQRGVVTKHTGVGVLNGLGFFDRNFKILL